MIIYGTRGVTYTKDSGDFYCPSCSGSTAYRHRRVRRFFTLYFIPLIPLDMLGEYVECQRCNDTFYLNILEYDPAQQSEEFESLYNQALKRVMVKMMLADGIVEADEVVAIQEIYAKLTDRTITEDQIFAEINEAENDTRSTEEYLSEVRGIVNNKGKELIILAAFMVAGSGEHNFGDEEMEYLATLGQALDMSPAQVKGVINSLVE